MFQSLWSKIVSFFMSILMALGIVSAPSEPPVKQHEPPVEPIALSQEIAYEFNTGSSIYHYTQGCCSDGKYIYINMNHSSSNLDTAESKIYKIDPKTGIIVKVSDTILVCSGADMAYNKYTGEIAVANSTPNKSIITFIDPETLQIKRSIDLGFDFYGMDFNESDGCYYVANSGGKAITKLTQNFEKDFSIGVKQTDFTRQSMCISDNFIYVVGSEPNIILAYDLRGNEYDTYTLDNTYKIAGIVKCDGVFYAVYAPGKGACRVCRLTGFSGQKNRPLQQEIMMEFPSLNGYKTVQGGCCSGKYIYEIMRNSTDNISALYVINPKTWTVVNKKENLQTDHGNDMCYNSKTNEVIILHGDPNKNLLSFFDADTLEYHKTVDVKDLLFSIDYDASQDCYYAGRAGAEAYIKFSSSFNVLDVYEMSNNDYTQQGMFLSGDKLHFIFWKENSLRIYNKNGGFVEEYKLPVSFAEPENGFVIDGEYYIVYNKADYTGGLIYKLNSF